MKNVVIYWYARGVGMDYYVYLRCASCNPALVNMDTAQEAIYRS